MRKILLALVLVLSSIMTLVGCGEKKTSQNVDNESDALTVSSEMTKQKPYILPQELENSDLVIVWETTEDQWKDMKERNPNEFNLVWSTKEAFERKYGGHVEVIGTDWGEMMNRTISMVNNGEVVDLVQANDQNFPTYAAKNVVQDISKYINVDDNFWYENVTQAFTFGGVPYAVGSDATPVVIAYNKTLFEQKGQKTPKQYFDEGNWTWDTFKDVGLKMTSDTDGDGKNDVYGFGWWDSIWNQMLNANGLTGMEYGNDGSIGSNYLSDAAKETFEFLQDGYTKNKFIKDPDGDKFIADFKNGKLAMTCEYGFGAKTAFECDYDIEWAPLPSGPSGKQYECGGSLTGFAIPTTSANPEGAAAFARMAYELELDYNRRQRVEKYGLQEVDLMNALSKNINFSTIGVDKYFEAQWIVSEGIFKGAPISEFSKTADELIKEGAAITLGK